MASITTDFQEVLNYLELLRSYGVPTIELRTIKGLNKKNSSYFVSTDEAGQKLTEAHLKQNGFEHGTVNCTFNILSEASIKLKKAIGNKDIERIRFLFIDIDPEREAKGSATEDEKLLALKKADEVKAFLIENGVTECITLDSGNGIHLFLPLEAGEVEEVWALGSQVLSILDDKFSDSKIHIDTVVANPGRLGKLIGTPAVKGQHSEERPHRVSKLLSKPEEIQDNLLQAIRVFVKKYSKEPSSKAEQKEGLLIKQDYLYVDAEKWLTSYSIGYKEKEGDKGGTRLLVFDTCPLSDHKNNPDGASLSISQQGRVRFRCLHASDKEKTIHDLAEKFPIPEEARMKPPQVTKEGLMNGASYRFGAFRLTKDGLFMKRKEEEVSIAAEPLFIQEVQVNRVTNQTRLCLNFHSNGRWIEKWIAGETLQQGSFRQLTTYGVDFRTRCEPEIIDYLSEQKRRISVTYIHDRIGWVVEEGKAIYQLDQSYSSCPESIQSTMSDAASYDFGTQGTYQEWHQLTCKHILGTEMELALVIGFLPIVLGYLNVTGKIESTNLIVNFQGFSSTGKSTALRFIASLYGNPQSLMRSLNATQNAIIKLASDNHGVPLILDELGSASIKEFSSLFYQLASGEERMRMGRNRELLPQQTFKTAILLSSESHLRHYLENQAGLLARYLEFSDRKWTNSAEESETIKRGATDHYGHAAKRFVEELLKRGEETISSFYEEARTSLLEKMAEHPLKQRISINLAMIQTAGLLVKELLAIDIRGVFIEEQLLLAYDHTIVAKNVDQVDSYELVKGIIIANASKFVDTSNPSRRMMSPSWGKVTLTKTTLKVNILKHIFEKELQKEFNTKDITYILKELIEGGQLQSEKGRRTKRIRVNKESITTYEIVLPMDLKLYFNSGNSLFSSSYAAPSVASEEVEAPDNFDFESKE